jgi:uncharacterized membrane protein (UPF0127 family)
MKKARLFYFFLILFLGCGNKEGIVEVRVLSGQTGNELGSFKAELADDAGERSMGLMFRNKLGANQGMLFVFSEDSLSPFWMQNTLIPLDIIFVDAEKKIVSLVAQAQPQTTEPRSPAGPYRYVLEIPGGRAAALGIQAGDRLDFSLP